MLPGPSKVSAIPPIDYLRHDGQILFAVRRNPDGLIFVIVRNDRQPIQVSLYALDVELPAHLEKIDRI